MERQFAILNVREVKTVLYVPSSHPFVERLIGTVRREYRDQNPFWSARDLERNLMSFQEYYNKNRVHRGLNGIPPNEKVNTQIEESLAWTIIVGKIAAVV